MVQAFCAFVFVFRCRVLVRMLPVSVVLGLGFGNPVLRRIGQQARHGVA